MNPYVVEIKESEKRLNFKYDHCLEERNQRCNQSKKMEKQLKITFKFINPTQPNLEIIILSNGFINKKDSIDILNTYMSTEIFFNNKHLIYMKDIETIKYEILTGNKTKLLNLEPNNTWETR